MQPSTSAKSFNFLTMIFGYTVVLHLALPAIAVFLKTETDPEYLSAFQFDAAQLFSSTSFAMILYAVAALLLVTAFKLPALLLRKAKAGLTPGQALPVEKTLVPYLLRISLFETISVAGLVLAIMTQQPLTILPFVAIGLASTLSMPPSAGFLNRFAAQAN